MILIIAEKPSLARNIAAAVGQMKSRSGYMEGGGYLITWAFGHLFALCDIETYNPSPDGTGRWQMGNLPCFPDEFRFELRKKDGKGEVDDGVRKQFGTIRSLCLREDVDTIVNAGDADREGEIIIRLCVQNALKDQPKAAGKALKRLWLPDQTPQTVREALSDLKDEKEYDLLASEGFARTYIDWLYGVNLTRYATLRTGVLLRVGRVIAPIVRAIYDRDLAIRNFVPGKYLAVQSREKTNGEIVELVSKNRFEADEWKKAEDLCALYNRTGAKVASAKSKKERLSPGKLYSLSKLQNVLGKKYKMPMNDSLAIVQKLYEQGYLTYPRTNSEYMATAEKGKVQGILDAIGKLGYPVAMRTDKGVFDDSKIESHSALTPTYKIPDKNSLSAREQQVYSTVFRRFVAVFCSEPCVAERSEICIEVGDYETFTLKGMVIVEPGWTKYDDRQGKDKILPRLKKGEWVNIDFTPAEKETTPPKHYTIETLNNYLKNPFKEEKAAAKEQAEAEGESEGEDDAEDYKAVFEGLELGTEATRTGIIENAIKSHYIELKKDVYHILPDGEFFIESLDRMQISMDKYKTSELGKALKKVYHGKITVRDSVDLAKEQIEAVFEKGKGEQDIGLFGDVIGACPLCGKPVKRKRSFYGCEGFAETGCKFAVNTFICGRAITVDMMKELLERGQTGVIDGFVSKNKKEFSAALRLDETGKAVFVFEDRKNKAAPAAPAPEEPRCPLCGKKIVKGKTAYGCAGWREGCTFRLPFEKDGTILTENEVRQIIREMMKAEPEGTPAKQRKPSVVRLNKEKKEQKS